MSVRQSAPPGWATLNSGVDGFACERIIHQIGLRVIASWGSGWDHVSVSTYRRCPTWDEMQIVAREFFEDDDTIMQLMVPLKDHVDCHPYCLHWWRPQSIEIPRPPVWMVGPKEHT